MRNKNDKRLLCLLSIFVLLWRSLPIEAVFAVEEGSVQETEAVQSEEQETDDAALETAETEEEPGKETLDSTYTNSISGMLWVDMYEDTVNDILSGDGIRQEGESPLSGYTVSLYKAENKDYAVADTTTGVDGKYEFTDLESGSYVVGVATEIINGTEYLLPFNVTSDNMFAMGYDAGADAYLCAYTAPIVITADSDIAGVNAGMRTPLGIETRGVENNYEIYDAGGNNVATYSDLNGCGGFFWSASETEYTIVVKGNDTNAGRLYIGKEGIKITITSAAGGPYIIGAGAYIGTDTDWAFIQMAASGSELVLENIILDNSESSSIQIGIHIENGGTLTMGAGTEVSNYDTQYGAIMIDNSTLNMNGGIISNNKANSGGGGGVQLMNNSTFTMNGGTISNNQAAYGGGVNAVKSAIVLSNSGTISGNTATTESGGGIQMENSTLEMNGGTISNNKANSGGGGGVQLMNGSSLIMNDGTIVGNQAVDGGGVNILSADNVSTFTMKGGLIGGEGEGKSNIATASGGGVFVGNKSKFSMGDGQPKIVGNQATASGGGVYVYYADGGGTSFLMTNGLISKNVVTGIQKAEGFYGHGGGIAFYVDNKFYDGGEKELNSLDIILIGGEINANEAIIGGGIGFFNNSEWGRNVGFTIGGEIKIEGNKVKTYSNTGIGGSGGGVGTATPFNGAISFILEGGTITNNTANNSGEPDYLGGNGGGIYCDPGTSFIMNNGSIDTNTAEGSGGGVYFDQNESEGNGIFTINDGTIRNNNASWEGGGIFLSAYSDAWIYAGTIECNKAVNAGGGICFTGGVGKLSIVGNETTNVMIRNNRAGNATYEDWFCAYGGGIYVVAPASLVIKHTTFTDNYAEMGGGGIFTTTVSGQNVPDYYENLDIDDSVTFSENGARYKYAPPKAETIAEFFTTVINATTTTSTEYKHALNHYDINRVLYEVRVIHLGPDYQAFYVELNTSAMIPNGNEFPTHTPAVISGYAYEKWSVSTNTSGWQTTDVYLNHVFEDSDILLYYEGLGNITIKKTAPDGRGLNGAAFMLEKWDTDTDKWLTYEEGTTAKIEEVDGILVFSDLERGKYQVTETIAPGGYSLLAKSFEVEIPYSGTYDSLDEAEEGYLYYLEGKDDKGETTYTCYYYDLTYTVTNQAAFTLPASGNEGFLSQYYLWIGLAFLLAAGGSHAYRKKHR